MTFVPLWANVVLFVLGAVSALAAIRTARTPQGAVGWVVFLLAFPLLAVPSFALFGRTGFEEYKRRRREIDRGAETAANVPASHRDRLASLERIAGLPMVPGNRLDLLVDGEATFGAVFEAIDGATDEVLVQFYMIRSDDVGQALIARLIDAALRGVRVHVLYDGVGSFPFSRSFVRDLRAAGVASHPIRGPRRGIGRFGVNFRNHRKTVVVDGRIGFTGGLNVGREYLDGGTSFAAWRDTFVRIEGPMVQQLRGVFARDWTWCTGSEPDRSQTSAPRDAPPGGSGGMVVATGPTDEIERGSLFLCGLVGLARRRLWIATPYLVPHADLLTAMQLAALRGVSVRILLPKAVDHLLPWYASRDYFDDLQRAGGEIWEYVPGFMHSKVVLVDDDIACVGTMNLDIRSVMLNFETTVAVQDEGFAARVAAMLEDDFARAELAPERHPSARVRLLAPVARLFGPLL